jgi:hypothetical protein
MFNFNRYKHRKKGERIIEDSLLLHEFRQQIEIYSCEINSILNKKLFKEEAVNIFDSSLGRQIRFFLKDAGTMDYSNCVVYSWGGWWMIKDRILFEIAAWNNGIRKINRINSH